MSVRQRGGSPVERKSVTLSTPRAVKNGTESTRSLQATDNTLAAGANLYRRLVPLHFDRAASCVAYSFCSIAMVLANKVKVE